MRNSSVCQRLREPRRAAGFTLIELITVVGIIAVLVALLLPSMITARKHAQTIHCASNMRQLAIAMINYTVDFKGAFPPNSAQIDQYWFTDSIMGRYLKSPISMPDGTIAGGVMVCPADLEGAIRSYSMNFFASSYISPGPAAALESADPPGKLFRFGAKESSSLILLVESFSAWDAPGHEPVNFPGALVGYTSNAIVGFYGDNPGDKFGAGAGAPFAAGRFGDMSACQVCYFRHRNQKGVYPITDAFGRANVAFVDGHVATFTHDELADFSTGKSRYAAVWSVIDRSLE